MTTSAEQVKFLVEELANRIPFPVPLSDNSILVTKTVNGKITVINVNLESGHTVANLNNEIVSVPYNGLQITHRIGPNASVQIYDKFDLALSSKLILDLDGESDSDFSGAFELLAKPQKNNTMDYVRFGCIGKLPRYTITFEYINSQFVLIFTNLENHVINVSVKVAK